ncbi:MAG TPA: hypothetical protein VNP73_05590, partial [Actinomycetota bacterium]|nr:hypothetical protein [Actinomycetota bacterium]
LQRIAIVSLLVAGLLAAASPAHALFHLMKITEVLAGTSDQSAAQFIEMQMYSDNQRFLATHEVVVYDGAGAEKATYTFSAPVENGTNQAHILLATPEAEAAFGVTADLAMTPDLVAGGGKACFRSNDGGLIDCASWGNYSGDAEGSGTPFNSPIGLLADQSMQRKTSAGSNPDGLDAEDDTDDSAADFESGSPTPTNNAGEGGGGDDGGGGETDQQEHERAVTLTLKGSLKAKGEVSTADDYAACVSGVPVKVQRKKSGGWKTVKSTETDEAGAYTVAMKNRPGRYRAKATPVTPEDGHECLPAASPVRKN